jgi:ssDNA-binding Zn-finger/Zn-ribbon topoisomerase 1
MNLKCLFGHKWNDKKCEVCGKMRSKPKLRSFGKEVKGNNTYEYYAASSAEEARLFLSFCEVTHPFYYISIATPEGTWGLDKEGLYLVELLPFQKNLSLAQCEGNHSSFSWFGVNMAARGISDNFVGGVICGSCGHEWKDGLRYANKTVVKCPKCKKYNCIDTSGIRVTFIN